MLAVSITLLGRCEMTANTSMVNTKYCQFTYFINTYDKREGVEE